jgi:replication-associated recombination protein RarA
MARPLAGSFQNSERQPTFAAHMRGTSTKRIVVVLDEFEKMDKKVQESLLGVLQNGGY